MPTAACASARMRWAEGDRGRLMVLEFVAGGSAEADEEPPNVLAKLIPALCVEPCTVVL